MTSRVRCMPVILQRKKMIGNSIIVAAEHLKGGRIVAIPTETVYGLAGNACDEKAVKQLFKIKQRPYEDPLIVHCGSASDVLAWVTAWPPAARLLASAFWPGGLTMLLPKKHTISDLVTAGRSRVAVRVPSHPMVRRLLQLVPFPLAAPSANPFGYISPTTANHVADQLGRALPYILDGGGCALGLESTIVGFDNGETVLYRLGSIAVEAIEAVVGHPLRLHKKTPAGGLYAPGTSLRHYAPRTPLVVGDIDRLLMAHKGKRLGVMLFQERVIATDVAHQVVLSSRGDLAEVARRLFAVLRMLDRQGCDLILAPIFPDIGMGKTINERLTRASYRG